MIRVLSNSVGTRVCCLKQTYDGDRKKYAEIIGAQVFHGHFVVNLLFTAKQLTICEDDITIFNFGVNDCIYRKDRDSQKRFLSPIRLRAEIANDLLTSRILEEKLFLLDNKEDNELFRIFTPNEFEFYSDLLFSLFKTGIVLSIIYVDKDGPKGYFYNEIKECNDILRALSKKHGFIYIDLSDPGTHPEVGSDLIHLAYKGHQQVSNMIMKALGEKEYLNEQPRPNGTGPDVIDLVIDDLNARGEYGIKKYGERLRANNGRDALADAYQEALDLCVYLRQAIHERGST